MRDTARRRSGGNVTGLRAHPRLAIRLPVTVVHAGSAYATEARDISHGGISIAPIDEIPFGASVLVIFRLATLDEESEIVATVRWKKPDGLGLQFGSLRALDVWALNRLFQSRALMGAR